MMPQVGSIPAPILGTVIEGTASLRRGWGLPLAVVKDVTASSSGR